MLGTAFIGAWSTFSPNPQCIYTLFRIWGLRRKRTVLQNPCRLW
uniref:Uncharacterized protein n=1 Tax=Anguilla anguilla TaxID=7936 RepID=A0A0E9WGB2_ANGAN